MSNSKMDELEKEIVYNDWLRMGGGQINWKISDDASFFVKENSSFGLRISLSKKSGLVNAKYKDTYFKGFHGPDTNLSLELAEKECEDVVRRLKFKEIFGKDPEF